MVKYEQHSRQTITVEWKNVGRGNGKKTQRNTFAVFPVLTAL